MLRRIGAAAALVVCVVALASPAGADDDQKLSISDVTVSEADGTATFTVSLTAGTDSSATVDAATANGSATAGEDYTATSETLTVPAGGSETFEVPILDGSLDEPNTETFTVNLSDAVGATIEDANGTGTITDNDATPTLAISGPSTVDENDGTATYSIAISGESASTVSVNVATANGTAVAPGDYTQTNVSRSWDSGDTAAKSVTVPIGNDTLDEVNENFAINLSSPSGATITSGSVSTSIVDDDAQPTTGAFANVSVSEGASGTVNANFVVNLSAASGKPITVNYSTIDGTATNANNDYEPEINQDLTIPAGQTSGTISIAVNGDPVSEPDETFTVNLNSGTNVTLGGDTQAVGTIVNDDNAPTVTIGDAPTVTEGDTAGDPLTANFPVMLSGNAPSNVSITYTTTPSSATAPSDYTAVTSGTLNIPAGSNSGTISIDINGDALPESQEIFFVDLLTATGATLGTDKRGQATINDDDSPPTVTIGDAPTVTEGDTAGDPLTANFPVTLSGNAPATVQITYSTTQSTATAPGDYTAVSNATLTIPAGSNSGTISIDINGDTLPESQEIFFVDLLTASGATLPADKRGQATIDDDDVTPTVNSVGDATVTEGNAGNVAANFLVTLSAPAPTNVVITYSTTASSATSDVDYVSASNATMTIPAGSSTGTIVVQVKGDTLPEGSGSPPAEIFFVDVLSATGAILAADRRGTGTITDDDNPVTASINDVSVSEGSAPLTVNATFTVSLSGPAQAPVQIQYRTTNGSASSPGDYNGVSSGTLTIPASQSSGPITILVKGDALPEGSGTPRAEDFFVDLVGATGPVTISSDSRGRGAIVDDDSPVTAAINDVSVTEGNTGTVNATFTVSLSGGAPAPVVITYSTANGTATAPDDYTAVSNGTLNIAQGGTGGTFTIAVKGDEIPEGSSENFFVVITATGATVSDGGGVGTITEDDISPDTGGGGGGGGGASEPSLTVADTLVTEGQNASFTVTLLGTTSRTVTVAFSTSNGTASAPADYVATIGTLTFNPGDRAKTVNVPVIDDSANEIAEVFHLTLSGPSNATLLKNLATATIQASDSTATPQGGGGTPPTGGTGALSPRMVLGPASVTVGSNGVARMTISCAKASPITCTGNVALETRGKPKFLMGKRNFSAKKGKKVAVRIFLSARALKLLKSKGTLKAQAVVVVKDSKKKNLRSLPGIVTLKASRALLTSAEVQAAKPKPKPAPAPKIIVDP